jgi:cell division protein FtsI/penicillin-binding protein 2
MTSDDLTTSDIKKLRYENHPKEKVGYEYRINYNGEGNDTLPKMISMYDALTYSSNSYFIKFVNDKDLYDELADIYRTVGTRVVHEQPYSMFYKEDHRIDTVMQSVSKGAVRRYRRYMEEVARTGKREPLRDAAWSLAWGQGELSASPLAMARVASIAAGSGSMPVTRLTMNDANESVKVEGLSKQDLDYLRYCMGAEAAKHKFGVKTYGKTGTAQRTVAMVKGREIKEQDGWYMGYFEGAQGPIAFALRIERGPGSGNAVKIVEEVLMPVFKDKSLGYVK